MPFIAEDYDWYMANMAADRTYGTNLEIQAFSDLYERPVHIYSDQDRDSAPLVVRNPTTPANAEPVRLSYQRGNHYQSVVAIDSDRAGDDSYTAPPPVAGAAGGQNCVYCDQPTGGDPDLHIAMNHPELFG